MNTAKVIQKEPDVNKLDDFITWHFGVHVWDPAVDKLAKQLPMPTELRGILRKSYWKKKGHGPSSLPAKPAKKVKLHVVPKPETSEPGQPITPKVNETDLADGRKFGKKIVTIRRKQGKRSCQQIGKRLLVIAGRNIGRGQVFYLAAAYGVMESR